MRQPRAQINPWVEDFIFLSLKISNIFLYIKLFQKLLHREY